MFIGIDLAGSEKRPSGLCILNGNKYITKILYSDKEILDCITKTKKVKVVAIDAPLSLPYGKTLTSKNCTRLCDKELTKRKIKYFPINFAGMKMLTERGMKLKKDIFEKYRNKNKKIEVIETYPGACYDILKISRKDKHRADKLLKILKLEPKKKALTDDEIDAIMCSFVAREYFYNRALKLGKNDEVLFLIPDMP